MIFIGKLYGNVNLYRMFFNIINTHFMMYDFMSTFLNNFGRGLFRISIPFV